MNTLTNSFIEFISLATNLCTATTYIIYCILNIQHRSKFSITAHDRKSREVNYL